ncbi:metal-dependent hydrolase [Flavobacterium sp.]|uniref:metal-dependent hydrolase n=1 Tax=Flavobacterium sp. TaxID=239 RepID=UPI00286DBBD3|nr:metal-dependent hydrolase [Flavobacterium sp.]
MDSLTQATLGGAIGELLLGKKTGKRGAIVGAIIATIPDLDVMLIPFCNNLQRITIHRAYSHSIVFSIIGAIFISFILSKIKSFKEISFIRLYIFSWLALFTHMLLDAFTTYGTQLFLPFSDYRVSFDSINIVDPFYTLPLLVGLLITLYSKNQSKSRFNKIGLLISTFYLMFTLGIKQFVNRKFETALKKQKIEQFDLLSVPVKIGSVNWYGVAKTKDSIYLGKYSFLNTQSPIHYESFPVNDTLLNKLDPHLADRLKWFSKGFYTVVKDKDKIRLYSLQVDMRGVKQIGKYKAPTAGFFEITSNPDKSYKLQYKEH